MILLHFFGLGDVLRRFELEQITGLTIMGFRPLSLDELMHWSQTWPTSTTGMGRRFVTT